MKIETGELREPPKGIKADITMKVKITLNEGENEEKAIETLLRIIRELPMTKTAHFVKIK